MQSDLFFMRTPGLTWLFGLVSLCCFTLFPPLWGAEKATQESDQHSVRLQQTIETFTKRFGAESLMTASAQMQLADHHLNRGDDLQAEPLLTQAGAILAKHHGPNHPEVADIHTKLARCKLHLGQFQTARVLLEGVVTALETSLGADHLNTASARINLARLLMAEPEQRIQAANLVEKALPVLAKGLWPEHPRVAEAHLILAKIRFAAGQMEAASSQILLAQQMREKSLGTDHPLVAEALRERGHMLTAQREFTAGNLFLRRSVEILERLNETESMELAASLERLGESLLMQERHQEAEPLFQRIVQLREQNLGKDHPTLVKTLNDLALLRLTLNDFPKAEQLFKRSLALAEKQWGTDHLQVAFILNNLAQVAWQQGQAKESEQLYTRSSAVAERFFAQDPLGLSNWFASLGAILHKEGRHDKAAPFFQRAVDILTTAYGKEDPRVVTIAQTIQKLQETPTARPVQIDVQPTAASKTAAPVTEKTAEPVTKNTNKTTSTPTLVIAPPTVTVLANSSPNITQNELTSVPILSASQIQENTTLTATPLSPTPTPSPIKQGFVVHLSCFAINSPHSPLLENKILALILPVYRKRIQNGEYNYECLFSGPFATNPEAVAAAERIRLQAGVENPIVGRYIRN